MNVELKTVLTRLLLVSALGLSFLFPIVDEITPSGLPFNLPVSAQAKSSIIYNRDSNTIEVKGPGSVVTLTDMYNALRSDNILERVAPFEWELKANLRLFEQVRLELHGQTVSGDVNWLKLKSDTSGFITVESSNGQISIRSTKITSWDRRANTFDTNFQDKRANISIKNRTSIYPDNRMDVIDSEIAYLGYLEETAYGISWKVVAGEEKEKPAVMGKGITGTLSGSKFHHNYYGVYVYGAGDMQVKNNEFYENYGYGFDAHTLTIGVTVENNYSHDNGGHGIIFAELCTGNNIRHNRSINNRGHGIMLHERSNFNVIQDNEVTGNDDGVAIFESSNNTITRNTVSKNNVGVRVYGRSNPSLNNTFEANEISGSSIHGVFMYDDSAKNSFRSNRIQNNADSGVYLKGSFDNLFVDNTISNNRYGVRLDSVETEPLSKGNTFLDNVIENNNAYGIYSYPVPGANAIDGNRFAGNGTGDILYLRQQGPGGDNGSNIFRGIRLAMLVVIFVVAIGSGVLLYRRSRARRG